MNITLEPVELTLDDEARLVYLDGRLLAVVTLQDKKEVGAGVHVEAFFHAEAPQTFESVEVMEMWIRSHELV